MWKAAFIRELFQSTSVSEAQQSLVPFVVNKIFMKQSGSEYFQNTHCLLNHHIWFLMMQC